MKKKYYAGIMMVAVSMAVTACGGGSKSPKSEVAEISAELEQQMNADDKAAIKEAQAELKEEGRSNTKAEPETETEEEFDPLQVDISVSGINPYEQELFEIFGLDNNFPKPKDSFEQKWSYSTDGYGVDSQTGETKEGIGRYELTLRLEPQFYGDYKAEIESYMAGKYEYKTNSARNNFTVLPNGNVMSYTFNDNGDTRYCFRVFPTDKSSLEGEVIDVAYQMKENGEEYPQNVALQTTDGKEIVISPELWAITDWKGNVEREITVWDHLPQIGEKVKISYASGDPLNDVVSKYKPDDERNLQAQITERVLITNFEFLN